MKTPSSLHGAAAVVAAALLLSPANLFAETATGVFARHREAVLTTRRMVAEGIVFCVGRAKSDDALGSSVGFGKAKSLAWGQADRWLFDTADWPEDTTTEERSTAWAQLPPRDVSGGEAVFEDHPEPGRWLVVLAIPETAAATARPTPSALAAALAEARKRLASEPMPPVSSPQDPACPFAEPRGLWEDAGVTANETMAEGQF
jgi:hypothetical protein